MVPEVKPLPASCTPTAALRSRSGPVRTSRPRQPGAASWVRCRLRPCPVAGRQPAQAVQHLSWMFPRDPDFAAKRPRLCRQGRPRAAAGGWFAANNAAFIGSNQEPTNQGQQNILYSLQRALRQKPFTFGLGVGGRDERRAAVHPNGHVTPPMVTANIVARSTATMTSVSHPPNRVMTQRQVVTQQPVVVTVTVQPTP